MNFTGERFVPSLQGEIRLEHYHRYALALELVRGKSVLDIACGEGYGSVMLAQLAKQVVGVDLSVDAIQHARQAYGQIGNLSFVVASALSTGLPSASFDAVVSFETIEHLHEQEQMIAELRRLLRPNGFLIISSPNRPIYFAVSGLHNEFHVRELDFEQLDQLLRREFSAVRYFGQRMQAGSTIMSLDGDHSELQVWTDDGTALRAGSGAMTEPVYFLAVCGERHEDLPALAASVVYPMSEDLIQQYRGIARWAQDCAKEIEVFRGLHTDALGRAATSAEIVAVRDQQIAAKDEQIE
jgi:O-antigen biosynthesis protein